jgi:transposase
VQALGRSVGGFSTKVHIKAEGYGKPMHFILTPGKRHETTAVVGLVKGGKVKRQGRGRPKQRSRYLVGDKAYSSGEIRQELRRSGTTPVIPKRSNEKRRGRFNRGLYRERNRVERLINRIKQYRRVATRYEKYAVNYLAMLMIAAIRLWLSRWVDTP